jgi:hypothetical protein
MGGAVRQVLDAVVDHTGSMKVFVQGGDHFVYMAENPPNSDSPWVGWTNL